MRPEGPREYGKLLMDRNGGRDRAFLFCCIESATSFVKAGCGRACVDLSGAGDWSHWSSSFFPCMSDIRGEVGGEGGPSATLAIIEPRRESGVMGTFPTTQKKLSVRRSP